MLRREQIACVDGGPNLTWSFFARFFFFSCAHFKLGGLSVISYSGTINNIAIFCPCLTNINIPFCILCLLKLDKNTV